MAVPIRHIVFFSIQPLYLLKSHIFLADIGVICIIGCGIYKIRTMYADLFTKSISMDLADKIGSKRYNILKLNNRSKGS
jgi:hypothetical protein